MIKKIALAFFAMFLLAGCSGAGKKHSVGGVSSLASEFQKEAGDRVYFALNSSELSATAKDTLMRQAKWLNENKHESINIIIEGHCDERGTREYNIALGHRRAEAVKKFMEKHGVSAERIETISYGKERPAVVGDNEEAWSKNRRGVTVLK